MFFFNYSRRQQEAHLAAGEDRLRIALAKRLELTQSVQQFWRHLSEWDFSGNIDLGFQVCLSKSSANIFIQPLLEFRQVSGRQGKADGVSMSAETREQRVTRLQSFQQMQCRY